MIVLLIGLAVAAAFFTRGTGLWELAVANAVASVWSNGVMANYRREEAQEIPNWAAKVSMFTAALSVIFIITAFIVK